MQDSVKAESADIFRRVLEQVKADEGYQTLRRDFALRWKDAEIGSEV